MRCVYERRCIGGFIRGCVCWCVRRHNQCIRRVSVNPFVGAFVGVGVLVSRARLRWQARSGRGLTDGHARHSFPSGGVWGVLGRAVAKFPSNGSQG